ncbi:hypothetical protein Y032_0027g1522 [Ancylostoma ceylanicum]|nr:hypothetical protein Y032_0027g1522 [Ancylostoma ceylanicum]
MRTVYDCLSQCWEIVARAIIVVNVATRCAEVVTIHGSAGSMHVRGPDLLALECDDRQSPNAYVQEGHPIITPAGCKNLHQEVELGVVIGKTAKSVPRSEAMSYVGGYTVALDMTARDFQDEAKKGGAPWFLAKSFDTACPVSKFIPKEEANSGRIHSLYYPLYARVTVLQNWREVLKDASPPSRF